tara:strand:+ start:233 stop:439 length:207 start_codon:yes stop_codon:yes gene_type:complete
MRLKIKEALIAKYKGEIAQATANVEVYLSNPVGIGEHPDIIEAIDSQMTIIAEAQDKLLVLDGNTFIW